MSKENEILDLLPEDLKKIALVVGIENAIKLSKVFQRTYIYVPGLDSLHREIRNYKIQREYDTGEKAKVLANKYGICERQVWSVLKKESKNPELIPLIKTILKTEVF